MAAYRTDGNARISQFCSALSAISDELTSSEVDCLKFLCGGHLTGTEKESVKSARDLFTLLEKRDVISKDRWDFIIELLDGIKRLDLVKRFKKAMMQINPGIQVHCQLPPSYNTRPQEMPRLKAPNFFSPTTPPSTISQLGLSLLPKSSSLPSGHSARASSSSGYTVTQPQSNLAPSDNTFQQGFQSMKSQHSLTHTSPPPTTSPSEDRSISSNDQSGHSILSASSSLQSDPSTGESLSGDPDAEISFSEQEQDEYKMDSKPRGVCVIINNIKFLNGWGDRESSESDTDKLRYLFEELHFKVDKHMNLKASKMRDELERVSQLDHGAYDCFACCILTHGKMGELYGVDGIDVQIHEILALFTAASCKSLAGKPKLFFIQACRGTDEQEGVSDVETDEPQPRGIGADVGTLPNEADFLLSFSTPPGYVSYRCPEEGSWYVSALVDLIAKHHNSSDLVRILTKVSRRVSDYTVKRKTGKWKQIPAICLTLRFDLFLHG